MIKKCLIIAGILFLAACSSGRETTTICELEMDGSRVVKTIEATGDRIDTMEEVVYTLASWYIDHFGTLFGYETPAELLEWFSDPDNAADVFGLADGMEYNARLEGDYIVISVLSDFNEMANTDIARVHGVVGDFDYISLEMTVEGLEAQNATCRVVED